MKYKIIAIDLDGTLLNNNKDIVKENIEVLNKLNKDGIEVLIATGRRYWAAKRLTKDLNMNLVIMANNGNIVRTASDDKVLVKKYLNRSDFYKLVKESKSRDMYPILHVDHYEEGYDLLLELDEGNKKYSHHVSEKMNRYKWIEDFLKYEDPKVLAAVYVGDMKKLSEFERDLKENYPKKYSSHIMSKLTVAGGMLEVMHPLGSKWLTLEEYAKAKGIKDHEIITIGDDNNDIEMIKKAGLGIAMKNGSDEVKSIADIVTDSTNNEGGVGKVLKKVFDI
ncbi:HAD family hydrolase [Dethiothermospora halolimnae]|uniref:HAD family hydrolase n=1 Tax=Dethiothermospora halolimnae TaxID=3114390 RepID=UPI003CCBDE40